MRYHHTQKGPFFLVLLAVAAILACSAWLSRSEQPVGLLLTVGAVMFLLLALSFRQLTVQDRGDHLAVCFGPLPLLRKNFDYASITQVSVGKSSLLDGLGIHYIPGRGWTYNLWGFDCVILEVAKSTVRIGTDDPENLASFLQSIVSSENTGAGNSSGPINS
jgi:hypothetical protein